MPDYYDGREGCQSQQALRVRSLFSDLGVRLALLSTYNKTCAVVDSKTAVERCFYEYCHDPLHVQGSRLWPLRRDQLQGVHPG